MRLAPWMIGFALLVYAAQPGRASARASLPSRGRAPDDDDDDDDDDDLPGGFPTPDAPSGPPAARPPAARPPAARPPAARPPAARPPAARPPPPADAPDDRDAINNAIADMMRDLEGKKPEPVPVRPPPRLPQKPPPRAVLPTPPARPEPPPVAPERPVPTPQPSAPLPAGYDPAGARKMAKSVSNHLQRAGIANYDRRLLKTWQTKAGIVPDGIYGGGTRGALIHYGVKSPPRPFFKPTDTKPYTPPEQR